MKTTKPPRNEIICGEAAEVMAGWPAECIDLTVTSPPYDLVDFDTAGNLITYPRQGLRDYEGYTWDFVSIARQLWRVTKRGAVVVWVVGDMTVRGSETLTSFRQALYFRELGFNVETMIYQVKGTGAKGSNRLYWQAFEYVFVLSKEKMKTINLIKDKKNTYAGQSVGTSPKTELLKSRLRGNGYVVSEYSNRTNVWTYHAGNNGDDQTDHSAPFPEALAADHIRSWSNPGDLVLDCFMGSGTTLKKAYQLERDYIGIDISANYCDIARRRVAAATMPIMEAVKPEPAQLALGLGGVE